MRSFFFAALLCASTALLSPIVHAGAISTVLVTGPGVNTPPTVQATPTGLWLESTGSLLVADNNNHRIIRVNPATGAYTTVAGMGTAGFSGDAGLATQAQLNSPYAVTGDAAGNVYIADSRNHRIRRVDAQSGIITTFAGTGVTTPNGDGIPAVNANIYGPIGMAFDAAGNLFIVEQSGGRIRRVDIQTGLIYSVAGNGTQAFTPDGSAALNSSIFFPLFITFDHAGNLLFSEYGASLVRRIDVHGVLGTVAGNGQATYGANGMPATSAAIGRPGQLLVDASGNLFFTSYSGGLVLRVDAATGLIQSVGGNGNNSASNGDGGPATSASIGYPGAVVVTSNGDLLVTDGWGNSIRKIALGPTDNSTSTALSGPASAQAGQSVTFTATVTPQVMSGVPTGAVQFLDNGTQLGVSPLSAGTASLPVSTLSVGAHTITANYSGDPTFARSSSAPFTISITGVMVGTTVSLTSPINPQITGGPVPYSVTVTPLASSSAQPSGGVQLLDSGAVVASGTVVNGSAQVWAAISAPGDHSLTAVYAGDGNFQGATSPVLTETIKKNPNIVLGSDANPSTAGSTVNFTATVFPQATGSIQFVEYPTPASTAVPIGNPVTLMSGVAVFSTNSLAAGTHLIAAFYSGDATYIGAGSSYISEVVRAATTTAIGASPASPTYGQSVQLTATVSPSSATGTVTFLDGGTSLGTVALGSGAAALAVTSFTAGAHTITAVYSGDSGNGGSTSTASTVTVAKATTTVSLGSSQNPASTGQAVTFTFTVTPSAAPGSVQLMEGATVLATVALTSGSATASLTPSIGNHTLTAVYSGDSNFAAASSAALTQLITATTATSLAANPASSTYGQAVQFTATVAPAPPAGSIQFFDGGTSLGTVALTGASAQWSVATLAPGSHSITAVYSGDGAGYLGSASAILAEPVSKAATTAAAASSLNPASAGQSVTFSATVSPATATGTVQFLDGATVIGTATLGNGSAALATSAFAAGSHAITATYSGDANYTTSSAGLSQTVQAVTATTLQTSASPANFGQAVQFTAAVSPATATGTVQFLDGATSLATVTLSGGSAVLTVSTLPVGAHSITAVYGGDANDIAGTSAALTETIAKAPASITVGSSLNPSVAGQSVTFSATVSPATATGTVQFLDGATALGTVTIGAGAASLTTTTLAAGSHTISAVYSGDGSYNGATQSLTQTVKAASAVSLTSNNASVLFGQAVQFTASVSPSTATGAIQFKDGATLLGTATLSGGSAAFATSSLAVGAHSITATYSGDGNDAGGTSAALTETIAKAAASIALTSTLNPSVGGQAVTFSATVSPATATGTVQFLDGATALGTVTISAGAASLTTTTLAAGSHTISAVYSGDGNYNSASQALTQTVKAATTASLTANNAQVVSGQPVQFTAAVSPSAATGAVQFNDGATVLGTVTLSAGSAVLTTSTLSVGTHTITAIYGGDASRAGSTSAAWTETITAPPPGSPSNLAATAASSSQINLSWTASATSGVTYNVYSATTSGFTPSTANRIATGLSATTYSNTGLSPSTTHYYVVTAQNSAGESAASNQAGATTPAGLGCHVVYTVTNQWNVGFGTAITIQNTGSAPISGWQLTWTWAGNQQITQAWNSNYSQTGVNARLTNASWNPTIAAGATLSGMGFNASYSGSNPAPTAFYVNGTLCH